MNSMEIEGINETNIDALVTFLKDYQSPLWTDTCDWALLEAQEELGTSWVKIAEQRFPLRSPKEINSRWNYVVKPKLLAFVKEQQMELQLAENGGYQISEHLEALCAWLPSTTSRRCLQKPRAQARKLPKGVM